MAASEEPAPDGQPSAANETLDANMAEEKVEAEIKAALAKGKSLIEARQFPKALRVIVNAVDKCPCDPQGNGKGRHGKDKSCHILQCMAAVKSDPDALYQVTKGPCACGYSWPSCTRPLHVLALDALADCLDKAGQYTGAFSVALATIRLDPASAVGYCRGGRILRYLLRGCSQPSNSPIGRSVVLILSGEGRPPSALLLRRLLKSFVQAALRNTELLRRTPKDSYHVVLQRMAVHLEIEVARRDPVKEFPVEVLSMIFMKLDTTDIVRCVRVNKQWKRLVLHDSALWSDLRLTRPGNPGRAFPLFLKQHPGVKSLVIYDGSQFQLTATRLYQIVRGLRQLRRLCLNSGKIYPAKETFSLLTAVPPNAPLTKMGLEQLSIDSYDLHTPAMQLILLSIDTLTVLDLVNTGPYVSRAFRSLDLPKLKKLRIIDGDAAETSRAVALSATLVLWIEMEPIVKATPNLEQFHLDGFMASWRQNHPPTIEKDGLWPSLRKLVLGSNLRYALNAAFAPWNARFLPPLSSNMRSIELLGTSPDIAHNVLFATTSNIPIANGWAPPLDDYITPDFPNLEVFRCISGVLHPRLLQRLLAPSVAAGKLQVLDLAVTTSSGFPPLTPSSNIHLRSDFIPARDLRFASCENLHTLGLHDFNFFDDPTSRFGATNEFNGEPFIEWLDCFPKLDTVSVYPGLWDGVAPFIMKLILHPKVKVIHQDYLRGVHWDEAQKLARQHGVVLHHTPNHMPVGWPLVED